MTQQLLPFDEVAWKALCDAVDAARRGQSAEFSRLAVALYHHPVDTVVAYWYLRTLLMLIVGESAGYEKGKLAEEATRFAAMYREDWDLLTNMNVENLEYTLLIAARAIDDATRADREPKIEHYVASAGLVLREFGKLPDTYRPIIEQIVTTNPLHPEMMEERLRVFRSRGADVPSV